MSKVIQGLDFKLVVKPAKSYRDKDTITVYHLAGGNAIDIWEKRYKLWRSVVMDKPEFIPDFTIIYDPSFGLGTLINLGGDRYAAEDTNKRQWTLDNSKYYQVVVTPNNLAHRFMLEIQGKLVLDVFGDYCRKVLKGNEDAD